MGIAAINPTIAPDINTAAAQFVTKRGKILINNQWSDAASGKTFPTYDPSTGEVLAQIAEGDKADIDKAVSAARAAFKGPWRKMAPSDRGKLLWKLADPPEKHPEEC